MKKLIFFFGLIICGVTSTFGQWTANENKVWAFGSRAGLDFTSGSPASVGTTISTSEGSASVSDASGSLLFYTDGRTIWDRTHGVMTGGSAITSYYTSSSSQGALIVPVIGTTTQYYVFSLENYSGSTGYCHLDYNIVDMTLSGGLGGVVSGSRVAVADSLAEKIISIVGTNCNIWVVVHSTYNPIYYAYNVTSAGVSTTPVVSSVGRFTSANSMIAGVMKSSHNGRHIVAQGYSVGRQMGTELVDFDANTGIVSNVRVLDSTNQQYGAEFAPNDSLLYCQSSGRIVQYDISSGVASTIIGTRYNVGSCYTWTDMRVAADGKIYFGSSSGGANLGTISNPNVAGSGCGYTASAFRLSSGSIALGLPNRYNFVSGVSDTTVYSRDTTVCITTGTSVTLTARIAGDRYVWSTGDTSRSTTVTASGTYFVNIFTGCHLDVDTIHLIQQTPDTSRFSRSIVTCIPTGGSITITPRFTGTSYQWEDGSSVASHVITAPGTYYAYITNGCHVDIDSVFISRTPPLTTTTRRDTAVCALLAPITITGRAGFTAYTWEDGSGGRSHSAPTSGMYYVRVVDSCLNVYVDTIRVSFTAPDTTFSIPSDTTLCAALGAINLNAGAGYTSYTWNTGSTAPNITVFATANYWVRKTTGCSMIIDTFHVTYIPIPVFSLGADRYECAGDTVLLSAAIPSSTYLWNNGTTNDSLSVTGTGLYWLNVYNGCTYRDSVYLTFTPYPVVDLGPDTVNCYGQPILLQSAGTFSTPFYLWSTGATTDTTTVTATDQYWLRVTVLGCATTDSINVTIHHDTFTLYNRDTAICMGKQVQVFLTANPAATFQWLPTTGIAFSTTGTPLITPDTSALYKVQISLADCPVLEDSFQIDVQPNPIVYAGGNRAICQYDTLRLYANVSPNWYTGYWYNWSPNINIDNFAVQDPVFTAGTTQKYVVTVSTTAGCVGKDSLVVNVNPGDFAAMGSDVSVCPGDSVQLSATGGVAYQWIPSMYLGDSTSGTPWIKAITNQRYTVIVTSAAGCRDTVEVNVRVFPGATFYQLDSFYLYPGETVQLSPQTNCTSVSWFPPEGLDNPFISNPIASPGTSSRYIVTGVTENGCIGKDTVYVNVMAESVVKTPNAFTPGKGTNNEYRINLRGEARLNYFRIYNRWGNLVFETKDISEGWDGNYKGTPQPFGVYVYVIQAVTGTGQLVTKQGNLTLLR